MMLFAFLALLSVPESFAETPCYAGFLEPEKLELIATCNTLDKGKVLPGTQAEVTSAKLKLYKVPRDDMYCVVGSKEDTRGPAGGWEGTPLNTLSLDTGRTLKRTLVVSDTHISTVMSGHGEPSYESKYRPEKYTEWDYDKLAKTLSYTEWQSDKSIPYPGLAYSFRMKCVEPDKELK